MTTVPPAPLPPAVPGVPERVVTVRRGRKACHQRPVRLIARSVRRRVNGLSTALPPFHGGADVHARPFARPFRAATVCRSGQARRPADGGAGVHAARALTARRVHVGDSAAAGGDSAASTSETAPQPAETPGPWPDGFERLSARRRRRKHGGVGVQVTRRLLFLGDSTYPLQNVSRVQTVAVEPDRWVPAGRFLTWLGLCVVALLLLIQGGMKHDASGILLLVVVVTGVAAIHHGARTILALFARARYLLIIETAGAPKAVIPGRKPEQMREIRDRIIRAIEDPDTEFRMTVETLVIGDPRMYHISNEVNMLDGTGNTGVVIS
ncbi:DUF6232 family protein [Streptomyces tsukubensis]|uniref:DUF6232 family protein n=1 Tax=Streptomyces tsukubensis TaxID=83656 RepID=UPI00344B8C7F